MIIILNTACVVDEDDKTVKDIISTESTSNEQMDDEKGVEKNETIEEFQERSKNISMQNVSEGGLLASNKNQIYISMSEGIGKLDLRTNEVELINTDMVSYMNCDSIHVYYSSEYYGDGEIVKADLEGKVLEKINNIRSNDVVLCENKLYYWSKVYSDNLVEVSINYFDLIEGYVVNIFKSEFDTDKGRYFDSYYIYNEYVYFLNPEEDFKLFRLNLKTLEGEVVLDIPLYNDLGNSKYVVYDDVLFYTLPDDEFSLYQLNLNTKENERIVEKSVATFFVQEDRVLFTSSDDNFTLYGKNDDGSVIEVLDRSVGAINYAEGIYYLQDFYRDGTYYILNNNFEEIRVIN